MGCRSPPSRATRFPSPVSLAPRWERSGGIHREKGVELVMGMRWPPSRGPAAWSAFRTKKERVFPCDLVGPGSDISPNSELAGDAGAAVDNGCSWTRGAGPRCPTVYRRGSPITSIPCSAAARGALEQRIQHGRAAARSMSAAPTLGLSPYVLVGSIRALPPVHGLGRPLGPRRLPWDPGAPEVSRLYMRTGPRRAMGLNRGGGSGGSQDGRGAQGRGEADRARAGRRPPSVSPTKGRSCRPWRRRSRNRTAIDDPASGFCRFPLLHAREAERRQRA